MSNYYGVNPMQARIAALSVKNELGVEGLFRLATKIEKSGLGKAPINRSQRRFEARQKKSKS